MSDKLLITVLDDGSLKIETDKVSMANHTNAEGLIREMVKAMGGNSERKAKHGHVLHTHDGEHYHEH